MKKNMIISDLESLKSIKESDDLIETVDYCDGILSGINTFKGYEILGLFSDRIAIRFENKHINHANNAGDLAIGIRFIGEMGKTASVKFNSIDKRTIQRNIEKGLELIQYSSEDPYFKDLPKPMPQKHDVWPYFDKKIAALDIENLKDLSESFLNVPDRKYFYSSEGSIRLGQYFTYLVNSNGISIAETTTSVSGGISLNLESDGVIGSGYGADGFSRLSDFSPDKLIEEAYTTAFRMLKRRKVESGSYELVFSPEMASELVVNTIASGAIFKNVYLKKSFLAEMEKKRVANPILNIKNCPNIPFNNSSSPFDSEGVPTFEFDLVKDGVLETFLYNHYWASRVGKTSNGCAYKRGVASKTTTNPQSLVVKPGDQTEEELISGIKKGIYCDGTGDSPTITSGQFSGVIMGYYIENGEICEGIEDVVLGTKLIDLYNRIEAIGSNSKKVGSNLIPSIKFGKTQIGGQ